MAKSVFITGVSSGIGYGLAEHYLEAGWSVFGVSRRTPNNLLNHSAFSFQTLDLNDHAAVKLQVPALLENANELELVILNAGVLGQIADMKAVDIDYLRRMMDTNVWSNKVLIDLLMDLTLPVNRVVTLSSGAAVNGSRGWNGYSISKAALNMLTQLYSREFPATHFAAVAPGLVDTAMQEYISSLDTSDDFPSIGRLQSKRGTDEMPDPKVAGVKLATFFEELPDKLESGKFVDIRDGI